MSSKAKKRAKKEIILPAGVNPAEALGRWTTSPVVAHGVIEKINGQPTLITTDSYILAAIPVETKRVRFPFWVNGEALRAAHSDSCYPVLTVEDDRSTRLDGARYDHPGTQHKHPGRKLIEEDRGKGTTITFDASKLAQLAKALGVRHGITVTVHGPTDPIEVKDPNGDGRGLLMPLRLDKGKS